MQKQQESEAFDFKRKQELELQAFMKRQKEEASGFHSSQTTEWNNLKEKHTQVSAVFTDRLQDWSVGESDVE